MNKKSDNKAKNAYKKYLEKKGFYDVKIVSSPSDIIAKKGGKIYYFEVKMTKRKRIYFGAATLTEWMQAFKTPDNFKFIIAITNDNEDSFDFIEYTPKEFMEYATIPPFKIYFNVNLKDKTLLKKRRSAIPLTKKTMKLLTNLFEKLKKL